MGMLPRERERKWKLKWFATGRWLSFVANRAQVLYKAVSEPLPGLTNVVEATAGATDAIDHIDGPAGEPLSDVKGLVGALNGGERGGVGAGNTNGPSRFNKGLWSKPNVVMEVLPTSAVTTRAVEIETVQGERAKAEEIKP
eukprot:g37056.t1